MWDTIMRFIHISRGITYPKLHLEVLRGINWITIASSISPPGNVNVEITVVIVERCINAAVTASSAFLLVAFHVVCRRHVVIVVNLNWYNRIHCIILQKSLHNSGGSKRGADGGVRGRGGAPSSPSDWLTLELIMILSLTSIPVFLSTLTPPPQRPSTRPRAARHCFTYTRVRTRTSHSYRTPERRAATQPPV